MILAIALVVANLLHPGAGGVGGYIGLGCPGSWIVTLLLSAAFLVVPEVAIKRRWDGIFIDERNKLSLSRFQLVLWTLLLGALFTASLSNVCQGVVSPLAIQVPASALLGIGTFSLVAARCSSRLMHRFMYDVGHPAHRRTGSLPHADIVLSVRSRHDG